MHKKKCQGDRFSFHGKVLAVLLCIAVLYSGVLASAAPLAEKPEKIYTGVEKSSDILKSISYTDIGGVEDWMRQPIYEMGALGVMKDAGPGVYAPQRLMTKEEALAAIFIATGRQEDIKKLSENLEKSPPAVIRWSDPYLKLALDEGLISKQEYQEAMGTSAVGQTGGFNRLAPVQRQELAYWIAKAMKLPPVYTGQSAVSALRDRDKADILKLPYIEAVLKAKIMHGDARNNFMPTQGLTRSQAAQVFKNAEYYYFPMMGLERKLGTIEEIGADTSLVNGKETLSQTYKVRNSNGKLHHIVADRLASRDNKNENTGIGSAVQGAGLVVLKDGVIGNETLLASGDRIEYITSRDNKVWFIYVLSNQKSVEYLAAQIKNIDTQTQIMDIRVLFQMDYPSLTSENPIDFRTALDLDSLDGQLRYHSNIQVLKDGVNVGLEQLYPDANVILTLENDMVTEAILVDLWDITGQPVVVKGIVEENNPQLGYITLYNEDGSGTGPDAALALAERRTYNYLDPNRIEVLKNQEVVEIEDIEPGDTAFLKLDKDGFAESVSAVDNYTVKYGKVISKQSKSLLVQYDNGTQQLLEVHAGIPVIREQSLVPYSSLKNGDRVKLTLNITAKETVLKEIAIEGNQHHIVNIYKGTVSNIDSMAKKLAVLNLQVFDRGDWKLTEQKGISAIRLAEQYDMYYGNASTSLSNAKKYMKSSEAYIAVERDYGGEERAVVVSFKNKYDKEVLYDDRVMSVSTGASAFSLNRQDGSIKYGAGSIIVKDGRLVSGTSIHKEDLAYVVANRSDETGEFLAGVVDVSDRANTGSMLLYRGRIKSIDANKSFTVESFSQLKGLNWEYSNTPKTFSITNNTRIIGDEGVINPRSFTGYGENSYKGRVVYILSNGTDATLISTAPFGSINIRGEILEVTGASYGEEGTLIEESSGFSLVNVKKYDATAHMWRDSADTAMDILANSIIYKNDQVVTPSSLKSGDIVRVLKRDDDRDNDAYIILVEN